MNDSLDSNEISEYRKAETKGDCIQLVTFFVGNEEFGIVINSVQEIISPIRITKVPNSREFIVGVINLRGRIIPIFDLKDRIKQKSIIEDDDTKIVVINTEAINVGLLVSKVNEVSIIEKSTLFIPSDNLNKASDKYIDSIANLDNRLVSILNLNQLLKLEES